VIVWATCFLGGRKAMGVIYDFYVLRYDDLRIKERFNIFLFHSNTLLLRQEASGPLDAKLM